MALKGSDKALKAAVTPAPVALAPTIEAAAAKNRKEDLEQQYISLLESRVKYLQALVDSQIVESVEIPARSQTPINNSDFVLMDGNRRSLTDDMKLLSHRAEGRFGSQTFLVPKKERYRHVVSKWDGGAGSRKDTDIGHVTESDGKGPVSGIAFTFRKVMDLSDEKKFKYSEVDIEAHGLRGLLREVIGDSYPGQSWLGEVINMIGPFTPIVHNWDELLIVSKDTSRDKDDRARQAREDLGKLLEYVASSSELEAYFKTRESNLQSKTTTYDTMWTLFRPGTFVVAKPYLNVPQVFEIKAPPDPFEDPGEDRTLRVECWCYDWNGKDFIKATFNFPIEKFRGTKEISSLFCCPLEHYKDEKGTFDESLRKLLVERGKRFQELCEVEKGAQQMFDYDDLALSSRGSITRTPVKDEDDVDSKIPPSVSIGDGGNPSLSLADYINHKTFKVKGRYIVDAAAYLQFGPGIAMLGKYGPIDVEVISHRHDSQKKFKDDQFLLCPPRVLGYATQQKSWGQFRVDKTKDVPSELSKAFDEKLELDKDDKKMLKALVENHESSKAAGVPQDVIEGKGKNLVVLLHGPPGVGKTVSRKGWKGCHPLTNNEQLTAETIAEATRKPLFIVSVAEIGLDASKAEKNLEQMFYLAGVWEAILLVDEADVFLESRYMVGDPNRNALVSVLLRVLEYFEGIIILTTNRITSLDIAVQSRIHLAIRYKDLNKEQKTKIFNIFLSQLISEGKVDQQGIQPWIEMVGSDAELNGRQIRNIVSSAYVLAHRKGRKLEKEDLGMVYGIMRRFQKQLEPLTVSARKQNEGANG